MTPKRFSAGHVRGGEDGDDAGMRATNASRSPKANARVRVRRAHRARDAAHRPAIRRRRRFPRRRVFGAPSSRGRRRPTAFSRGKSARLRRSNRCASHHRLDDRAIAGAAAQHAAERVLRSRLRSGRALPRSSATAASSTAGVQTPHCAAPWT